DNRILQGLLKAGALQDAAKVFQADVVQLRAANARIAEGIKNCQQKGRADQQQNVKHGGTEHGETQQRALRSADRLDLRAAYCHVNGLAGIFFSVVRSKNFKWRSGTAKS